MKLFITNRGVFENTIENHSELRENTLNSHLIHKKAFSELYLEVSSKNSIPINISVEIDKEDGIAFFKFISYKQDVYFYEFQTT